MKRLLFLLILSTGLAVAQGPDVLTTDSVVKMVQSGVPAQTIIRTIQAADRVNFTFLPGDLELMARARVPEDVFKAMAAKSAGKPVAGIPAPVVQAPPAEPTPRRDAFRRPKPNDNGELLLGEVEPRFFAGANGGPSRSPADVASYSIGAEVAVGLFRNLEATGVYCFDHIGKFGALSANAIEFMGGAKVPFPSMRRVTPYLQGSLGGVHGGVKAFGLSLSQSKFAFAVGGGADVRMSRHIGIGFDARAVKINDIEWQYRTTGGVFFRF